MTLESVWQKILLNLRHFGARRTAYDCAIKAINRVVELRPLAVIHLTGNIVPLPPGEFEHRLMTPADLAAAVTDPVYELTPDFIDQVLRKGDECWGAFSEGMLLHYAWYSTRSTPMSDQLSVRFSEDYTYMYKIFTHPASRGRGINRVAVLSAYNWYVSNGRKGLLAYVESNNFSSLRSLHAVGFKTAGSIGIIRLFNSFLVYTSEACRRFNFHIETNYQTATSLSLPLNVHLHYRAR